MIGRRLVDACVPVNFVIIAEKCLCIDYSSIICVLGETMSCDWHGLFSRMRYHEI